MPLTRTWSAQAVNQTLNDETSTLNQHKSAIWAFKRFITGLDPVISGGAWTIERSSDGVTAGAGDNWGGTLDLAKLIWHTAGSAHSWIVFKSPAGFANGGGFIYLLIDLVGTGPDAGHERFRIEMASDFAPFTGGTTLAAPTSTSRGRIASGVTKVMFQVGLFPGKWHGTRNTKGDFLFFFSRDGQSYAQTVMAVMVTENYEAVDNYPVLAVFHYLESSSPLGPFNSQIAYGGTGVATMLWSGGNQLGSGDNIPVGTMAPRAPDAAFIMDTIDGGGSDISGNYPQVAADVWNWATGFVAYRGRLVDVAHAPTHASVTQTTGTPASSPEKVIIGSYWVPFTTKPVF